MASVQIFDFFFVANDLLTATFFSGILDDTMRFWPIKDQFRTLHMAASEFTFVTVTTSTTIDLFFHLLAVCEGLATIMAFRRVLFLYFVTIVFDRTTPFLIIG